MVVNLNRETNYDCFVSADSIGSKYCGFFEGWRRVSLTSTFWGHRGCPALKDAGSQNKPQRYRVARPRALMAAMALITSGTIISMMVDQYLSTSDMDNAITRSRLWWEVVLNLQILSAGTIWFTYVDAIAQSKGRRRLLYILSCSFGTFSVLLPSLLGAIAAFNNWFEVRPEPSVYYMFFGLGIMHWLVGVLLQYLPGLGKGREKMRRRTPALPVFFLPVILLVILVLVDGLQGGSLWLVATPFLLYLQGAIPFIARGVGFGSATCRG